MKDTLFAFCAELVIYSDRVINMRSILFLMPILLVMACETRVSLDESELESEEPEFEKSSSSSSLSSSSSKKKSSSSSQNKHIDGLPFDLEGSGASVFYKPLSDYPNKALVDSVKEKYGDAADDIIIVYYSTEFCRMVYENGGTGRVNFTYAEDFTEQPYYLLARDDSLLYTQARFCTSMTWDGCRRDSLGYMKKIETEEGVFYYSKIQKRELIVQIRDTSIYTWYNVNSDYVDPNQRPMWDKKDFEKDSLVQFIGTDTLFIEKYNVKITDEEKTWVFENETCSPGAGEDKSVIEGMEVHKYCNLLQRWYDEDIACIQRNMGVSSDVYPRLCRKANKTYSDKVWCILD